MLLWFAYWTIFIFIFYWNIQFYFSSIKFNLFTYSYLFRFFIHSFIGFNSVYNFHNMRILVGAMFVSEIKVDVAYISDRTMHNRHKTQISIRKCANRWCQLHWTKQFTISKVIKFDFYSFMVLSYIYCRHQSFIVLILMSK